LGAYFRFAAGFVITPTDREIPQLGTIVQTFCRIHHFSIALQQTIRLSRFSSLSFSGKIVRIKQNNRGPGANGTAKGEFAKCFNAVV
jgi:hypothetical protein